MKDIFSSSVKKAKLGDICQIVSGGTPKRSERSYWEGGKIPWIKISDIKQKHVCKAEECITEDGLENSSAKILEPGALLFSIFASIGAVGILDIRAATNQAIAGLNIIDHRIDQEYLYYWLKAQEIVAKNASRGVAQNNINLRILREMEIAIPDRTNQRRIIKRISTVERQIDLLNRELNCFDQLIKSRFVETQKNCYIHLKTNEVAKIRIGPFGSMLHKEDYVDEGHPVINPSNIQALKIDIDSASMISDEKYKELASYHLYIGDIVLGRRGELGRCAVVENGGMVCGTGSMLLRSDKERCLPLYFKYLIQSDSFVSELENKAVGITMKNLNEKIVGSIVINVPPLDLQNQFADFVKKVDEQKAIVRKQIDKLQMLYDSLAQEYFSI